MPEIELDDAATAKTLNEHMADELAAERNKYDALIATEFVKTVLVYAGEMGERAKEQAFRTLDPRDRARSEVWESLGNGTFFSDALKWRLSSIRAEYRAIERIRQLETQGPSRKSDRHGNALGEYELYQPPGIDPSGPQPTRR